MAKEKKRFSRAAYIVLTIVLLIAYGVGLPMFIIGITGDDMLLYTIIGLGCCGLPTGIIFWIISRAFDGWGSRRNSILARRLFALLLGIIAGLVITPILLIYCLVCAIKPKKPAAEEEVPAGQQVPVQQSAEPPAQDVSGELPPTTNS